jgi:hypothetical protein
MSEGSNTAPIEPPLADGRSLQDVWMSAYHLPALVVADEVGLFPFLAASPASPTEVARGLTLGPRGTTALLGILAALGFLVQHQGRFHLTAASRTYLLPDSPYYYGGVLHMVREHPHLTTPAALREALQGDQPVAMEGLGEITAAWETGALTPEQAIAITAQMHSHSLPAAMGVARYGDFAGVRQLLDVAGGSGCFCIALALRDPQLRCTVLELPAVCPVTEHYIARAGLQGRISTVAANMFTDAWPTGYDAVLFSNIFHDWDRESCLHLSRCSFAVLPPGGRIYLHELLLADTKDGPLAAASFSLVMLTGTRGQQFTLGELSDLLGEAGFAGVSLLSTYADYSLVTASKPP